MRPTRSALRLMLSCQSDKAVHAGMRACPLTARENWHNTRDCYIGPPRTHSCVQIKLTTLSASGWQLASWPVPSSSLLNRNFADRPKLCETGERNLSCQNRMERLGRTHRIAPPWHGYARRAGSLPCCRFTLPCAGLCVWYGVEHSG